MSDSEEDLSGEIEDPTKSPSIIGEEATSESMDIDKALGDVGLPGDTDKGPHELDVEDELQEEEL